MYRFSQYAASSTRSCHPIAPGLRNGTLWEAQAGINEKPIDRYLNTRNFIRIPKSRDWLEESFYNRDERHVREDSVVTIDKTEYDVPPQFAGKWVEVRFNPTRMEDAYILYNGEKFPISRTDRVKNGSSHRNNRPVTITYHSGEGEAV